MTHQAAKSIMCSLGLRELPTMTWTSHRECFRHCYAFYVITGRKALPETDGKGRWWPKFED
jgi:hypothetical protein